MSVMRIGFRSVLAGLIVVGLAVPVSGCRSKKTSGQKWDDQCRTWVRRSQQCLHKNWHVSWCKAGKKEPAWQHRIQWLGAHGKSSCDDFKEAERKAQEIGYWHGIRKQKETLLAWARKSDSYAFLRIPCGPLPVRLVLTSVQERPADIAAFCLRALREDYQRAEALADKELRQGKEVKGCERVERAAKLLGAKEQKQARALCADFKRLAATLKAMAGATHELTHAETSDLGSYKLYQLPYACHTKDLQKAGGSTRANLQTLHRRAVKQCLVILGTKVAKLGLRGKLCFPDGKEVVKGVRTFGLKDAALLSAVNALDTLCKKYHR